MGEKRVGGLISVIAVMLLSVVTFGLAATNQSNRDAQSVEVTITTSEEVVNSGEGGSNNNNGSPVGVADSSSTNESNSNNNSNASNAPNNQKNIDKNFTSRSPNQNQPSNTPPQNNTGGDEENNSTSNNDGGDEGNNSTGNNDGSDEGNNSTGNNDGGDEGNNSTGNNDGGDEGNNSNNRTNPNDDRLDKSSVSVDGQCVAGVAKFTVTNTGEPGNGDMTGAVDYRLYVNEALVETGQLQLQGAEVQNFEFSYAGKVRLEVDQRPGHPGNSEPNAVVEDCVEEQPEEPQETCTLTVAPKVAPYGRYNGKHAVYLKGFWAEYETVVPNNLQIAFYDDWAEITGTVQHINDASKKLDVYFKLTGKTIEAGAYTGSSFPKTDELKAEAYDAVVDGGWGIDPSTWTFYSGIEGQLVGQGSLDGIVIEISGKGPYFQIGEGANQKNAEYGAASWFDWKVTENTNEIELIRMSNKGDINVNIECEPEEEPVVQLGLTAECVVNGQAWWRVTNKSGVDTDFTWNVYDTSINGSAVAAAGEIGEELFTYFTTPWNPDSANTTNIFWTNPADGKQKQKGNAHNNQVCVGHVEFVKTWEGVDGISDIAQDIVITAESSIATATCEYVDDVFTCDYREKGKDKELADLFVPFGEKYTVTETGLSGGWSAIFGADEGTEYVNVLGLLEGFVYDIDEEARYCEHNPQTQPPYQKYCEHEVVNQYTPEEFVCDSLYYVNHISNSTNDSPLFRVNLAGGKAQLTEVGNFDFDQVHIATSLDGKLVYGFDEDGLGIQIIDLDLSDGDQSVAANGVIIRDEAGKHVKSITQAAFSPTGKLYIGSAGTDKIYEVVNVAGSQVVSLGKVTKAGTTTPINIGGADIAFGADGEFYLMTRADSTIYEVDLSTMTGEAIGQPGKSTGLAILDEGAGDFVYSDTESNEIIVVQRTNPNNEVDRYPMYVGDTRYKAVWGDMAGGCIPELPEPIVNLEIVKEAAVETVNVGETFVYEIKVSNVGDDPATGVVVTDNLPDEVEFVSVFPDSCEHADGTITCSIGELAPGSENEVVIEVTVEAVTVGDAINNVAVVHSNEDDDEDDDDVDITPPPPTTDACIANLGATSYKNYSPAGADSIDDDRKTPEKALGLPTPVEGNQSGTMNFVSLGIGGSIELYFDGAIYDGDGIDFYVVETSWGHRFSPCEAYPEKLTAEIFDGENWLSIDGQQICRTGGFDIDGLADYALGIRLTDDSEVGYASDGDGYDIDGVTCEPPPEPVPDPEPEPDPDYACEAIGILDYSLGTTKGGNPIPANRSIDRMPAPDGDGKILSVENDDTLNFVSLGFGDGRSFPDELGYQATSGWIVYDFGENSVLFNVEGEDDLWVVETSWGDTNRNWENYPEQANIYASKDAQNWVFLGNDRKDMTFDLGDLDWARYVMVVDVSDITSSRFGNSVDAFDMDGLSARECGEPPQPPPPASCEGFHVVDYSPEVSVDDSRDDAWQAEAAERVDAPPVNFVSLGGEGGYIILEPSDGALYVADNPELFIWETTYGEGTTHTTCDSYKETATIEVRQDDGEWIVAGEVCRDGSVDLAGTGLEWVSQVKITDSGSTTPDGYDVDGLTCEPSEPPPPPPPPYDTCDMLLYSHNPDQPNQSFLYNVYLNTTTGNAEMYLIDGATGWGDSHIAASADGSTVYFIENKSPYRLGIYDVATNTMTDAGSVGVKGVTQAALHPETGLLYIGGSKTDQIYTIDLSNALVDATATALGQVKLDGKKININGADIAFGADGTFYLATRSTNKIYEVDLDTMAIVATVASKTEMNGMTIEDSGRGQFVYASRGQNAFVRTDGNSSTAFSAFEYGEAFDVQWGDMASCITFDEPDDPDDPPQCDALFNLVENGSFEKPVVRQDDGVTGNPSNKNWDVFSSEQVPGWDVEWNNANACDSASNYVGVSVLELQKKELGLATPVDGNQYAELDSDCQGPSGGSGAEHVTVTISQTIDTTPGKHYSFSFWVRSRTSNKGSMAFSANWGSEALITSVEANKDWTQYTFDVVADSEETVISFSDDGSANSFGIFLDDVVVDELCDPPPSCTYENRDPRAHLKSTSFVYDYEAGTATTTVTNNSEYCDYEVGMASYEMVEDTSLEKQVLHDWLPQDPPSDIDGVKAYRGEDNDNPDGVEGIILEPGESRELTVNIPDCAAQVDVFFDANEQEMIYGFDASDDAEFDQVPLILPYFKSGEFGEYGDRYNDSPSKRLIRGHKNHGTVTNFCSLLESDLELEKTGPEQVNLGEEIAFTIVGTNNGPDATGLLLDEGTIITDYLPTNADFVSVSWVKGTSEGEVVGDADATCSVEGGVLTCDIGILEVSESVTATVIVQSTEVGVVENTARIDPELSDDEDDSNNEDGHNTDVVDLCELDLDPEAHLRGSIQFVEDNVDGTSVWKGVVTNSSEHCNYEVGMAAYEKHNGGSLSEQVLFDSDPESDVDGWGTGDDPVGNIVGPGETIELVVTAPACATQLDLFYDASHYGIYEQYDQANADLPPLVLPQFNTNNWGPYGNMYGVRLLSAKHINNDNDCAGPAEECEADYAWITESSTDNSIWSDVDGSLIVTEPGHIKSSFTTNPKKVEYFWNGQKVHTENANPYYFKGDNRTWLPTEDGTLVIRAYSKDGCFAEETILVDAPEPVVEPVSTSCPMVVTIGDTVVPEQGLSYTITDSVVITSNFIDGYKPSRVRYYVNEQLVDDENAAPYVFLGDNKSLSVSQAQAWAGDDGSFLLYIAAEKDGEVVCAVNVEINLP